MEENFKQLTFSKNKIFDFIKSLKIDSKKILLLTLNNNGETYLQEKYKKAKSFQINLNGDGKWKRQFL